MIDTAATAQNSVAAMLSVKTESRADAGLPLSAQRTMMGRVWKKTPTPAMTQAPRAT